MRNADDLEAKYAAKYDELYTKIFSESSKKRLLSYIKNLYEVTKEAQEKGIKLNNRIKFVFNDEVLDNYNKVR